MAKYGLGQVDLNLLAQMGLAGLTAEPEHHLSRLLRSGQPIEEQTRIALADALDGRPGGSKLKLSQTGQHAFVRSFRKLRQQIEIGRRVEASMDGLAYADAIEKVTQSCRYGDKSVERFYTMAKDCALWIGECRKQGLEHTDEAFDVAFIYSKLKKIDRKNALKPSVELFAEIFDAFECMLVDAEGARRG